MIYKIKKAKNLLLEKNIDAWIIYDYECTNDVLISFIGKKFLTRRLFLVIPKSEKPFIIANILDIVHLNTDDIKLNFEIITYRTWNELIETLNNKISGYKNVIMEISTYGTLPKSSYCDYGTVKLIEKFGIKVHSSADLLIHYTATYKDEALKSQYRAMEIVSKIKDEAFSLIEKTLKQKQRITEYDVTLFIVEQFKKHGLVFDSNPIVAVNKNAGNPHYEASENISDEIKPGDLILIDLWAKEDVSYGVYADITWMGYAGKNPPKEYIKLFEILKESIDNALDFLNNNLPNRAVCGYEVDDVVRNTLKKYNYEKYLIHRVGHSISIDNSPHGKGTNIDNYETHDERHIINNTGFSIEPGIYTKEFGLREEIDVYIENNQAICISPQQKQLITMDIC